MLLFLGYVSFLKLRLVPKLSINSRVKTSKLLETLITHPSILTLTLRCHIKTEVEDLSDS